MKTLTADLRALSDQIAAARTNAQQLWTDFDTSRSKVAGTAAATDPNSPDFKVAEAASKAYGEAADQVQALTDTRERLLGMTDAGGRTTNGPQDGEAPRGLAGGPSSPDAPGLWLANALGQRRRDIPTLPDHVRSMAPPLMPDAIAPSVVTTGLTATADGGTFRESDMLFDLLAPLSVALNSGIQVLRIDGTETKIPRFTELPVAGWVAELGTFPKSAPGIERVNVKPPKVGFVTPLSVEVFEDLTPLMLSMLQVQLLRAVALAFDRGILFGSGAAPEPRGVANTTGIAAVTGVPLTNLAAFAEAIADLIAVNASPGALVMNPIDVGKLLKLTEAASGTGSNVPLWKASVGSPSGLRLPYFDIPIWPTPAAPVGQALLYDPTCIVAILRRQADIAIDPYYSLDDGKVGFRCYLRGDVVVGQAGGAVHITFSTPA